MSDFATKEDLEAFKVAIKKKIDSLFPKRLSHPPIKPGQDVTDSYLSAQQTLELHKKCYES